MISAAANDGGGLDMRPRIAFDEVDILLVYLLRSPSHFLQAKILLRPEHFLHDYELGRRAIWRQACAYYDMYQDFPSRPVLEVSVLADLDAEQMMELQGVRQDDVDMTKLPDAYGFDLMRRFLHERDVLEPARAMFASLGSRVPVSMPDIVKALTARMHSVETIGLETTASLVPTELPSEDSLSVLPTGIDFLDIPMGGGRRRRETIGLLGALGSGKSTIGVQASVSAAKYELAASRLDPTYEPEVSFFVTYEQPKLEIQRKAIACSARIALKRLHMNGSWLDRLSTCHRPDTIESYERNLVTCRNQTMGELERYYADTVPLDRLWRVVDLSGSKENPRAGYGYVDEICAALEREKRKGVKRFGLVVIDYAMLMCRNYCRDRGWDETKKMRILVNAVGDDCRRTIAVNFDCTVLLLHQLSGESNTLSPTARLSHGNSAEGKMFGENQSYCFELGVKDESQNCVLFRTSKTRHTESVAEPAILRYSPWSTLEWDQTLEVDHTARRIVSSGLVNRFGATEESRPRPAMFGQRSAASIFPPSLRHC